MNTNLLLDVAELALKHLSADSTVCYVNINSFYITYKNGGGVCRISATKAMIREALKTMFPIYKNMRKHTSEFKISSKTAYETCDLLSIKLRPLEHIIKRDINYVRHHEIA